MRPQLGALLTAQAGLFTRRQALHIGYSPNEVRQRTRRGTWVMVRTGVYTLPDLWAAAHDQRDGRLAMIDHAAHMTAGVPHVMSHDSAARAWGLALLDAPVALVHLTRLGSGTARTRHGVKSHRTRLGLLNTRVVHGMRITGLARTAVDLVREHGSDRGLVALDGAMRAGVLREDLSAEFANMWCWPGSVDVREGIELADPGADNPGESLARLMLLECGLVPETQFPVRTGGSTAWVDLRVGRHLIEFDGRLKYRPAVSGGLATRPVEDVVWEERQRQGRVCAEGFGMSRVGWDEVITAAARRRTSSRVMREMATTHDRFGSFLTPEQGRFAERMATERQRRILRPLKL